MSELRRWSAFTDWRTATRFDVERWIDGRPLGARARYSAVSHLAAFYRWAIREGLVATDPTMLVDRPKLPARLPRPVPAVDVDRIMAGVAADPIMSRVVLLMLDGGLRCVEVARLRWRDVDLEAGVMYVHGKGDRERLVGLPQRLRHCLYLHAQGEGPVIGVEYSAARVSQRCGERFRELGVDATAHRLRHTYATRLYRATAGDLRAVQLSLGHASVATTQMYAAVDVDRVVEAARMLE